MQEEKKRRPENAGDAGRCAELEREKLVQAFFCFVLVVTCFNLWVEVAQSGIQIRGTADFLLDEFIDKIRVLS
jgi:hypothetical protein